MAGNQSLLHIDEVSEAAQSWLEAQVKSLKVHFPRTAEGDEVDKLKSGRSLCAALFLSDISPDHPGRSGVTQPETFTVTYSGTLYGATTLKQHRAISDLYFAAHSDTAFEIKLTASPVATFTLSTKLVRPARISLAPPVTDGINVGMTGVSRAIGRVTSTDGIPIPRADVSAPTLDLTTATTANGTFVLDGVPTSDPFTLRVIARGRSTTLSVAPDQKDSIEVVMNMEKEHA